MKKTTVVPDPMTAKAPGDAPDRAPLWLQVARWCLGRNAPVNREAVSLAFGIPLRQAGDIMLYISGRRGDVVQARRQVAVKPGGIREATLEVIGIREDAVPSRGGSTQQASRRHRVAGTPAALRDLVLGRRRSGGAT